MCLRTAHSSANGIVLMLSIDNQINSCNLLGDYYAQGLFCSCLQQPGSVTNCFNFFADDSAHLGRSECSCILLAGWSERHAQLVACSSLCEFSEADFGRRQPRMRLRPVLAQRDRLLCISLCLCKPAPACTSHAAIGERANCMRDRGC